MAIDEKQVGGVHRPPANERQIGGRHYKTEKGIPEHWDLAWMHNLDYFQGQITKYVMRWKEKGGVQDLLKAQHFLEKYIEVHHKFASTNEAPSLDDIKKAYYLVAPKLARLVPEGSTGDRHMFECRYCHKHVEGTDIVEIAMGHECSKAAPAEASPTRRYVDQG